MSQPKSNGLTRTQKDLDGLLKALSQESLKLGQVMMNLGTCAAHLPIATKHSASDMCTQAENLRAISDELVQIANRAIDWEMSAIKQINPTGLLDANGNEIGG